MKEKARGLFISKKSENISEWYNDVVLKAELADHAPVRGTMVIRPWGYAIWEHIQKELDAMIKDSGVKNAYFPLFIPESHLKREKEHVEGFSPELAVVTIGGGEELKEKLIVRPTSETIMYSMYAKWIQSWRDLPLKINQWSNVVRWEKRPYLFLRTTEFLWQEGHTAHATHKEAVEEANRAIEMYQTFYREILAMDGIAGSKSAAERFAGAETTLTYELLMPDGKALQGATSHDLGQNFSKVFEISYLSSAGNQEYVWQTSWGFSTRSIGGLILMHGDDSGLVLPPRIAPLQVIIVPIFTKKDAENQQILKTIGCILSVLRGHVRIDADLHEEQSPGWKFNEWELRGVPLRLEIGPRDVAQDQVLLVRRDTGEKRTVPTSSLLQEIPEVLEDIQKNLFERSRQFLKDHTNDVSIYEEFQEIMRTKRGFLRAFWCENPSCEQKIKEETKATARCLPLSALKEEGTCILCGKRAQHRWIFGQAY